MKSRGRGADGGEAFSLAAMVDREDARRIVDFLSNLEPGSERLEVRISGGVSLSPVDAVDPSKLVKIDASLTLAIKEAKRR